MMNYIWLFLILFSILVGTILGNIEHVTKSAIDMAGTAVTIAIGLIGIMALWLGIMKIAEQAGIIRLLARLLKPLSKHLFPDIPSDHPAIGSMLLNISANWLGLGNAATPFGIKAMEQLQELNDQKDTATNSMIMFLGLNTASITLLPMTIIGVRTSLGSSDPAAIIGTTIFSSFMATITAIITVKIFTNISLRFNHQLSKLKSQWKGALFFTCFLLFAVLFFLSDYSSFLSTDLFKSVIAILSKWAIPVLLFFIPVFALFKKIKVYEVFIEGAKEGFQVAIRIIPFLVAILVTIGMFRASGAMDLLAKIISPITNLIGMPAEILPAAIMRPLSGSGTLGIISELLETHGPDSFMGNLASTIYGCTETTFYVIAVYFGAVGIKKIRFAAVAGLIADAAGILAALFICRLVFL